MLHQQKTLVGLIIMTMFFYGYYLLFHFRITDSAIISLIIALIVLIFLAGGLYYLAYRWMAPGIRSHRSHLWIMAVVIGAQFGMAISVWFVQNKNIPVWLLSGLNRWFPFLLDGKAVEGYNRYFPLINFLFLSAIISLVAIGLRFVIERITKRSLHTDNRVLLIVSYGFLLLSITTCVYCTDFLQIGPGQQSIIWYGGTEDYINYRVEDDALSFWEDLQQHGGFVYGRNYEREVVEYLSATGFYGSLLKLGQSITKLPPDDVLKGTRVLMALLTAVFLTAVSLLLKKKFGLITSLIFSSFSLITYWLMGPASHLIWFFPLFLIPLSIGIFLYPLVMDGRLSFKRFLLYSSLGYFFLFLRGYDYAPVVVLSGAIPVLYYEIMQQEHWKKVVWRCIQVCWMGVVGFAIVMVVHFFQLWLYLGTSAEAADYLFNRAISRSSGGDTNLQTPLEIFWRWMEVRVFYLPNQVFAVFPQWEEPFNRINTFRNFHLVSLGAILYALFLLALNQFRPSHRWMTEGQKSRLFALALVTPAALLSSWSWFPALGHMSHHYHMNGIMYMIPFGLTAFVLFGVLVEYSFQWVLKPK
jgi:hypothetical protein